MPNDSSSGQPSALVSWRVGRSLIEPTMEWTKNCMLYFHDSVQTNTSCSDLIVRFFNMITLLFLFNISFVLNHSNQVV